MSTCQRKGKDTSIGHIHYTHNVICQNCQKNLIETTLKITKPN